MALSIKTEEADRLARDLARRTGRSMTAVVTEALREKLEREKTGDGRGRVDRAKFDAIAAEWRVGADLRPSTKEEFDEITEVPLFPGAERS